MNQKGNVGTHLTHVPEFYRDHQLVPATLISQNNFGYCPFLNLVFLPSLCLCLFNNVFFLLKLRMNCCFL